MKELDTEQPADATIPSEETTPEIPKTERIVRDDETETSERYPDVYFEYRPGSLTAFTKEEDTVFLFHSAGNIDLRIEVLTPQIIRCRYALQGKFAADFSYAIDEKFRPETPSVHLADTETHFIIRTDALVCKLDKHNFSLRMETLEGDCICEDGQGFYARATILQGLEKIALYKKAQTDERYYGLGDKSGALDLRGQQLENWATDAFAFGAETDPLYKSIPFYFGLYQGRSYGIFFDNTYRTHFDFASEDTPEEVCFSAAGGEINYYFIYGPELMKVAEQYTQLTGTAEMPPMWALGFHQCRWSYYPERRVREIAKEFRKREIPCDAIYLDIDYMDGYRCFTWNKDLFPNPTAMIRDLREKGFKTIVMIDPGLKVDEDYEVYQDGLKKDYYCKRPDGDLMTGPVWPSDCVFPDFTIPQVRSWWGHQYRELYSKNRVAGFWNDMNEPAVFKVNKKTFPENVRHHYDGHPCSHAKAHNIYGLNMSRATQEGLLKLKNHRRPFVITRATYSGGQRYSSVWTGDNVASWEHLQIANRQCQRLSISGFSFTGSDIGGFVDEPTGELMVRWLQLGIFHPLYRIHSMGNNVDGAAEIDEEMVKNDASLNRMDQEPWAFGETYEKYAKYAIELRYQLLPYHYTCFWQYSTQGTPMLRSLVFYDQTDERLGGVEREFMFGDHLLVSPVIDEKATTQTLYLPKGNWYHYWTGTVFTGGQEVNVAAPLSQIPIFVKAGAVLPHYPIRQYTDEYPIDELMLHVYFAEGQHQSMLYEDAGDGFEFKEGQYSKKEYTLTADQESVVLTKEREGNYRDTYLHCSLLFYGLPFTPQEVEVDGQASKAEERLLGEEKVYVIKVSNRFKKVRLS